MITLTDAEIIARLTHTEDSFVERKSKSDKSGWLKSTVAFANSAPPEQPAVLFLGVNDDGSVENGVDAEKTLQIYSDHIGAYAWPPILYFGRAIAHNGKPFIAVLIPGSLQRPHFSGRAWIRNGTQTKDASDIEFANMVASRNSKAAELQKWIGKFVTVTFRYRHGSDNHYLERARTTSPIVIRSCGPHYVTFEEQHSQRNLFSEPLSRVQLSFDHGSDRLHVYIYEDR